MAADEKLCPYCGERIKSVARKCRFCGEMLDEPDDACHINANPSTAQLATCPRCKSSETSEYMPTRWKCFRCGAKFIIEEAPSIVVQPTRETVIHTGPTDTRKLEQRIETLTGVKPRSRRASGKICPRCGSTYLNPVNDRNKITPQIRCHNCGYTYDQFNSAGAIAFLVVLAVVVAIALHTCAP